LIILSSLVFIELIARYYDDIYDTDKWALT
jgi:hypothetical protein